MHKLSYYLLKNAYFELINDYLREWDKFVPMSLSIEGHLDPFNVSLNYIQEGSAEKTTISIIEVASIDPIVNSSQYFELRKLYDRYRGERKPVEETLTLKIIDNKICYNIISSIKVDWVSLSFNDKTIEIDSAGYPMLFSDQCIYKIKVRFILNKKTAFKLVKE